MTRTTLAIAALACLLVLNVHLEVVHLVDRLGGTQTTRHVKASLFTLYLCLYAVRCVVHDPGTSQLKPHEDVAYPQVKITCALVRIEVCQPLVHFLLWFTHGLVDSTQVIVLVFVVLPLGSR